MNFLKKFFSKPLETVPAPVRTVAPVSRLAEVAAGCPFPVSTIAGDRVEAEILRLRRQPPENGIAVIIGEFDRAELLQDTWDEPFDVAREIERSVTLDVRAWFAARKMEDEELYSENDEEEMDEGSSAPMNRLTVGYDCRGKPHPEVFVVTVPTKDVASLPVHLRYGGWNSCPEPHVHMALASYWKDRYGAEIVTLTADVIEFTVARPPTDDKQAEELAFEQFLYCSDIVHQGVGSVATLARTLRHSTRWYFWWD